MNMADIVDRFLHLVSQDLEQEVIKIEAKLEPGAEWAYADPWALQKVLLNLIYHRCRRSRGKAGPENRRNGIKSGEACLGAGPR